MQLADAGWRIYHLEGRLNQILGGLEQVPGAEPALDIVRTASDAVSLALDVFDGERVSEDAEASRRIAAILFQARLGDVVRLVERLPDTPPNMREFTDLRMCVAEIDALARFFDEEWPASVE